MTTTKTLAWIITLAIFLPVARMNGAEPVTLKTQKYQQSYAIGADLARNLKRQGVEVEADALIKGMRDAIAGDKMLMTEEQIRETLMAYQNELRKKRMQIKGGTAVVMEENRDKGIAFLAANKTKEGVVSLPSGLQYKILNKANGPIPGVTNTIVCNFKGTFIDGTEFNSSQRAGQPATLKMSDMIPGWKEAIQRMPVGSKWQLFVPSDLAYAEKGVMSAKGRYQIPPNSTVIFEVELLGIK